MRTRNQSGTSKSKKQQLQARESVVKTATSRKPRGGKRQKTVSKILSRSQRLQARTSKAQNAAKIRSQEIRENQSTQAKVSPGPKKVATPRTVDQATPTVTPDQATASPHELFTNFKHPTAYSSNIHEFLRQNEAVSRHKRRIQKFDRRKTQINGPFCAIQVDTM